MSILGALTFYGRLPFRAKREVMRDILFGVPKRDPGILPSIDAAVSWICRAQDMSRSNDGGVARHFSLIDGWSESYPETTGYIIPTLLACAEISNDTALRERAVRMLDWLTGIQLENGAFQGGMIHQQPVVPVTFNTGQVLLGLAAGENSFGMYADAMLRAADWLVETQDADGCWRRFPTPFAAAGEKVYETHVSLSLYEVARLRPDGPYAEAASKNVRWALRHQGSNGWFDHCCLGDPGNPLTHTIGYVLRGLIEAYRFEGDRTLLEASLKTAEGLLPSIDDKGFMPGRLNSAWKGSVTWSCLTGSVQIAHCLLLLYGYTGDSRYRDAGYRVNGFVRKTVSTIGKPDTRGGVKGAFPVNGDYGAYQYLSWAAKFFIDSHLLELETKDGE